MTEDKKAEAHTKFQEIAFAYSILSDVARRKTYDATGSTHSAVDLDGFNWTDFYREQYSDAVSDDAITKFAKKYKKSQEEKEDILAAYEDSEGNMDGIYESVMLSDVVQDDKRFRAIIDAAIADGDVPAFDAYTKESKKARQKRLKAAGREARRRRRGRGSSASTTSCLAAATAQTEGRRARARARARASRRARRTRWRPSSRSDKGAGCPISLPAWRSTRPRQGPGSARSAPPRRSRRRRRHSKQPRRN